MKRLTSAERKAKQLLEETARKIGYLDYEVKEKDLIVFFEQCYYDKKQEIAASEIVEHIREFGRFFL